jgi:hypothetical protein
LSDHLPEDRHYRCQAQKDCFAFVIDCRARLLDMFVSSAATRRNQTGDNKTCKNGNKKGQPSRLPY